MAELPRGTVTLLFTDIEGSTRLLYELGDGYADVLSEHRRVLRDSFARYRGVEVDTQGDGPSSTRRACPPARLRLRPTPQKDAGQGSVRVRIGLHTATRS